MRNYNAKGKAINIKYVYHFLKLNEPHFQNIGSKMQMPQIATPDTDNFLVPIPCPDNPKKSLEIQAEIVRILDNFTELTARKKQYNYYRDQLLGFEDLDVEWKPLEELATITIGEFVRKDKQNQNAKYPVFNGGRSPTGYYEDFNNHGDKIIVSARGANAGFVNKSSTPYWAGNSCYSISVQNDDQLHSLSFYNKFKTSRRLSLMGDWLLDSLIIIGAQHPSFEGLF